jgi:hypothetical protein
MYIIFLLLSFRDARVNRYRVGPVWLPRPDRDRAGPSSAFLWGHVKSTRALLQTPLVLLREEDSFELGVIAMTIHHGGQPLGKSTFGAWLNCKRQRSSERHELTHHNSSLSEGARGWSSTL